MVKSYFLLLILGCLMAAKLTAQAQSSVPTLVPAQIGALVKEVFPKVQYAMREGTSILQIGVPPGTTKGNQWAQKICQSLQKKAPQLGIQRVILEDGITAYGACDCQSGKTGFDTVKDRALGYYYFAGKP